MSQETNKIEYFKGEFLHPSLDIKNEILIIGFRFIYKDLREKEIFVVATREGITACQDDHFDLEAKKYFIEIKGRLLARIDERWGLKELIDFINGYNSGTLKTPTLKEIFENTKELLKKYVELETEEDYPLISSWILGSYFFPIFSAYPFLHIKAPKQSGKSQCLNFLKQTSFNAVKAKPSLAALSDTVDSLKGVYLIDQADLLRRRGNEEVLEILTDSYKKEGGKRRIRLPEKRGGWKTVEQETYGPKAYASVGELPEDLADRCLTIPLIKSRKNFPEPHEESENWRETRGQFYMVSLTNFSVIKNTYDVLKTQYRYNSKIVGRDLELWLPLETILKYCVEETEIERLRIRFKQLYGYTEYQPSELEKTIIEAVYESLEESGQSATLSRPPEIREKIDEDVWEEKFLTPHQQDIRIGYIIKKFNLSSEKKPTNKGVAYLFEKEKVEKIRNLYCKSTNNTQNTPPLPENLENSKGNSEELENPNTP